MKNEAKKEEAVTSDKEKGCCGPKSHQIDLSDILDNILESMTKRDERRAEKWKSLASAYHKLQVARARAKHSLRTPDDVMNFLIMSVTGSVGKMSTSAKRMFAEESDADFGNFADALASIRIYVETIANHAGIDLDGACLAHMEKVCDRADQKSNK